MNPRRLPSRIVCLTTETVEVLYALGEQDRIAGISGYTVIPPRARKEKPKVFAFSSGDLEKILAVAPDLVLGFSDMQADVARDLIKAGVAVHVFNQRSVAGILAMIETVGRLVGAEGRALALVAELEATMDAVRARAAALPRRPRVYFEEWDEPPISAVGWVSELVAIAGGEDVFAARGQSSLARGRILESDQEVFAAAPELIVGSWCGKRFAPDRVRARPGWADVPAVRNDQLAEIKSALILQPGPAAILDGLPALQRLIEHCAALPAEPRR